MPKGPDDRVLSRKAGTRFPCLGFSICHIGWQDLVESRPACPVGRSLVRNSHKAGSAPLRPVSHFTQSSPAHHPARGSQLDVYLVIR